MKWKVLLLACPLLALLLISACNIFSVFAPTRTQDENSIPTLLYVGESSLKAMNYSNAYNAYLRVLQIEPSNSIAREGICTAYLYWKIPLSNFVNAILTTNLGLIPGGLTTIYDVAGFIATNLEFIIMGKTDRQISSNDINIGADYFIFNTFNAVLSMIDMNSDRNFMNDQGDIFTFTSLNPPAFTNNFGKIYNNIIGMMSLIQRLPPKLDRFMADLDKSTAVLSNLVYSFQSTNIKTALTNVSASILQMKTSLLGQLAQFNLAGGFSNFTFSNLLAVLGFTNGGTNTTTMFLVLLSNSQITNYAQFTNQLSGQGMTNMLPPDIVTNLFPDLGGTNYTNFVTNLTNYH